MSATRIAVITGSRAEFGLLAPVIRALRADSAFDVRVIVCGAHLLPPARTIDDVQRAFGVDASVEMQRPGETGRLADAAALGRGVQGIAAALADLQPHWTLVLGDRIEAFAGAGAASVGGIPLAHIHGGDRAEGVADEAMRHAITKLAHLHLAATPRSAERIIRMGEDPARVHIVGSPAIDGLDRVAPLDDVDHALLGRPDCIVLLHPAGLSEREERSAARAVIDALRDRSPLLLAPNFDPGREWILEELQREAVRRGVRIIDHLPRIEFLSLAKRLAREPRAVIVGNSSAGLIECSALKFPAVNIGPRQAGRERPDNVFDVPDPGASAISAAIEAATSADRGRWSSPYGPGDASVRIAQTLKETDPSDPTLLRKRCAY